MSRLLWLFQHSLGVTAQGGTKTLLRATLADSIDLQPDMGKTVHRSQEDPVHGGVLASDSSDEKVSGGVHWARRATMHVLVGHKDSRN